MMDDIGHPFGFESPAYYYGKGFLGGFAVAIELAEESESIGELISKLQSRLEPPKCETPAN